MQTKTITYKRILNLGNYESKHLEETIELLAGEDVDFATSQLMERVERKIREDVTRKIEDEIGELRAEVLHQQMLHDILNPPRKKSTTEEEGVEDSSSIPEYF